jgi:hypothetical protein
MTIIIQARTERSSVRFPHSGILCLMPPEQSFHRRRDDMYDPLFLHFSLAIWVLVLEMVLIMKSTGLVHQPRMPMGISNEYRKDFERT